MSSVDQIIETTIAQLQDRANELEEDSRWVDAEQMRRAAEIIDQLWRDHLWRTGDASLE